MRRLLLIAIAAIPAVTACNYTEGQCYYRGEGGGNDGVGGGVIVANGAGGFGDVPPEPQDAAEDLPPVCNSVRDNPCNEKCLADYIKDSSVCEKLADRTPCDHAAYARYNNCRGNCVKEESDCKERCKKQCDKIHDRCHEDCNKNGPTSSCRVKCNNEYSQCLRECNDDCK